MKSKLAKAIRVITVPPVMAFAFLSIFYAVNPSLFGKFSDYLFSVFFLVVLPVLAYLLQPLIAGFRKEKREGQRNLAMIMSVAGYAGGVLYAYLSHANKTIWIIFLTYLLSGVGIFIFNKVIKIRASGHACAAIGPVSALMYFLGVTAFAGIIPPILVFWSSLKMKRHTAVELFWGSMISVSSLVAAVLICPLFIL